MNRPPVPTVLIAGFLGAGKTTFIQTLLPLLAERGLAPYVLINDYRNAEVDASSLRALTGDVRAINGDCICCDSLDALVDSLLDIHDRPRRVVFVEANGTSDPYSLIEHLTIRPELRDRFTPLLQVTVVDASRWQHRAWHNKLERLQTETASHLVLNHQEAAGEALAGEVRAELERINPGARFTDAAAFADLSAALADGSPEAASAALPPLAARADRAGSADEEEPAREPSPRHALAHGFIACQVSLPPVISGRSLLGWLRALPGTVLRVKGAAQLQEFPGKHFVFQRTDDAPRDPVMKPLPYVPTMEACAVLIGVDLDVAGLRHDAEAVFGPPTDRRTGRLSFGASEPDTV